MIRSGATTTSSTSGRWKAPTTCVSNCHASWIGSTWDGRALTSPAETTTSTSARHSSPDTSCRHVPILTPVCLLLDSESILWCFGSQSVALRSNSNNRTRTFSVHAWNCCTSCHGRHHVVNWQTVSESVALLKLKPFWVCWTLYDVAIHKGADSGRPSRLPSLRFSSICTVWEHQRGSRSSSPFLCTSVCKEQHRCTSPMSSSVQLTLRPRTPPLCFLCVTGCPSYTSTVGDSGLPCLILLLIFGTVCPNVSCPHPLCLFYKIAARDVTDSESASESGGILQFFRNPKSDGYLKSDRDGCEILVSVQLKCYFRK